MAAAPPRWVGQTVARAGGARFPDGNTGAPVSGIRRELQRTAAALPVPSLKVADGARFPLALAAEGCRPRVAHDAAGLDIFEMEVETGGARGDPDALSERLMAPSETCSEASNNANVMNVLEDFIGWESEPAWAAGLEPAKATAAGRLFRNKSGLLPAARPAIGGGFINAKPSQKVRRSQSAHQPKAGHPGGQDQVKVAMAPPPGRLLQRRDCSLQSMVAKGREATFSERSRSQAARSLPVPISHQFCDKRTAPVVDEDSPFMPPHKYLSLRELSNDPDKVPFANPSAGRLKGLSSLRMRNIVLTETGYYEGYTEMWQQPKRLSPEHPAPEPQCVFSA